MDRSWYITDKDVESEQLYDNNQLPEITEPFNPKDVDIISLPMVVGAVMERLYYGDIILDPDFQRTKGLWTDVQQSRLIESLIIRIPLPSFYFDQLEDKNERLIVVDGLQRLWALKRFAVLDQNDPLKLRLCGLEYLSEYNGRLYEDLPIMIRRRIREQVLNTYVIRPGTPDNVRSSIFTRINTGGVHLLPAEIRNAVYRGQAAETLKFLAGSMEFINVTRDKINSDRMMDREFVNRFFAFYLLDLNSYKGNLDEYLNQALCRMKMASPDEIQIWKDVFKQTMNICYILFGDKAFRKKNKSGRFGKINKPLFECSTVALAKLSLKEQKKLLNKKEVLWNAYEELLHDQEFLIAITNGTASINSIKTRHHKFENMLKGIIDND